MNKDDRRAKKTERVLKEALTKLLCEKELKDITIKELTDTADIHRATFYTHYEDIYDLYNKIEGSVLDELSALIISDPTHSYKTLFATLFEYLYDNLQVCSMLFGDKNHRSFTDGICNMLKEKYIEISRYEIRSREIPEIWNVLIEYHIRGYVSMIALLIKENKLPEMQELIQLFYRMDCRFDAILEEYR